MSEEVKAAYKRVLKLITENLADPKNGICSAEGDNLREGRWWNAHGDRVYEYAIYYALTHGKKRGEEE